MKKIIAVCLLMSLSQVLFSQEIEFTYDPAAVINNGLHLQIKDGYEIVINNQFSYIYFKNESRNGYTYAVYNYAQQFWLQIRPEFNANHINLEEYFLSVNLEITELDRLDPSRRSISPYFERVYFEHKAAAGGNPAEKAQPQKAEQEEPTKEIRINPKIANQYKDGFLINIATSKRRLYFRDSRNPDLTHGFYDLDRMCWDKSTDGRINKDYIKLTEYLINIDMKEYDRINIRDPEEDPLRDYKKKVFYNYSKDIDFRNFLRSPLLKNTQKAITDHYKIAANKGTLRTRMQRYFDLHKGKSEYNKKDSVILFKSNKTVPLTIIEIEPPGGVKGEKVILRGKELARQVEKDLEFYFHKDFEVNTIQARMDYHIIYKDKTGKMTMPEYRKKLMAKEVDHLLKSKQLVFYCFVDKTERAAAGIYLNTPLGAGVPITDWYTRSAQIAIHEMGHMLMLPHHFHEYTEKADINYHTSRACVMNYAGFRDYQFCELCRYALGVNR